MLARPTPYGPGRIYVKGLLVAEEPNFLFSYNITAINASLRRALEPGAHQRGTDRLQRTGEGGPQGVPLTGGRRPAHRRPGTVHLGPDAR